MDYQDYHEPVLVSESVSLLVTLPGLYIDGTLGGGGHSLLLLRRLETLGGESLLVGIDQDTHALEAAAEKLGKSGGNYRLLRGNFGMVKELVTPIVRGEALPVMGFLLDLGVSSYQIDTPERGFSYLRNGPLDMRMDPEGALTAADVVNEYDEAALARLFFRYGEEPLSRRIAKALVSARSASPLSTTGELAEVVRAACPRKDLAIKTLSRIYQALRIEVNDELGVLEQALADGFELLSPGGRLAVISYHSLEDRIVKRFFSARCAADWGPKGVGLREPLKPAEAMLATRKPVEATPEETGRNPRARSARLRVIQKL
ncbi:16S rRNA (cytosine(1402)-N(4))-methyltransferase RsmH [Chlorobaculum sp. 24CR]|uniref:16S rRNA (cytosine(1402)-N(4))-methyltransferase RsmH n=1 Tax=Chlorobaculum sp. 24CR TaxID=2508878 RepID=UPI00100A692B|nr:16S rRNA (cytosine(1402)-N(4))-methyltransferase RsmH [Chlorobaculum sp. 24CR]RXK87777.1 16S rRNA (cytosine(1402)-N(4))-methyltransferase RsmH [Chlorobaculum sp. 24CR]